MPKSKDAAPKPLPVVLITGCSSGFGFLAARLLASHDFKVYATMRELRGRNASKARDLLSNLPHGNLHVIEVDVLDESSIKAAVDEIIRLEGRIDILVNNAGYGSFGPVELGNQEKVEALFDTNVLGYIRMLKAVLPHMRANRGGKIINIASVMGLIGLPMIGYYSATKSAIVGLSEALTGEGYLFNIKVTVLAPMGYSTDFLGRSMELLVDVDKSSEYQESFSDLLDNVGNFGKISGDPSDVAKKILWIAKKQNPPFLVPVGKFGRTSVFLTKFFSPLGLQKFMARVYGFKKMFKKK